MPGDVDFEALHRAALRATRDWSPAKASMAFRALGLDTRERPRASLDAIAADFGVSRETARRARNELLRAMQPPAGAKSDVVYSALSLPVPTEPAADSPATARALRRLLTMTGPLPWDVVLSAWARAGGKFPYSPLPADIASMRAWANDAGGFNVSGDHAGGGSMTIGTVLPEELDHVSQFLFDALREQPSGVDRQMLLELAEGAGLKATTIATTLSMHPAITRVGRGRWALLMRERCASTELPRRTERKRAERVRPTAFTWDTDGALLIEFSVPRGPSPVVAVPKAVSPLVEGREFGLDGEKPMRLAVRKGRLWGFGPRLSELSLPRGARVTIALNLLDGTASIRPVGTKGTT